jgi:hypothetical protein
MDCEDRSDLDKTQLCRAQLFFTGCSPAALDQVVDESLDLVSQLVENAIVAATAMVAARQDHRTSAGTTRADRVSGTINEELPKSVPDILSALKLLGTKSAFVIY